jgi:peptidoglycan/LPS O-acetylase OafA/YrhL
VLSCQPTFPQEGEKLTKHVPALDGLRGIAILMVFAYHYRGPIGMRVCNFGWSGVDLFFVLSGFLITGILYDTRADAGYYKKFYARRALRIFPVFYLFAAVMFMVGSHWKLIDLSLLFYVGWPVELIWPGTASTTFPIYHLWSLSVEEQFYIFWPLLMARVRRPLVLCVVLFTTALLLRILIVIRGISGGWAYCFLPCRMDGLAVGAAIALLWRSQWKEKMQEWALPCFAITSAALLLVMWSRHTVHQTDIVIETAGFSLIALTYGALLIFALKYPAIFSMAALRRFGKYSYGFYLFHIPLISLFSPLKPRLYFAYVPFCLLANLAVAALSFHFFEQPILRLKRRFSYNEGVTAASKESTSISYSPALVHPGP